MIAEAISIALSFDQTSAVPEHTLRMFRRTWVSLGPIRVWSAVRRAGRGRTSPLLISDQMDPTRTEWGTTDVSPSRSGRTQRVKLNEASRRDARRPLRTIKLIGLARRNTSESLWDGGASRDLEAGHPSAALSWMEEASGSYFVKEWSLDFLVLVTLGLIASVAVAFGGTDLRSGTTAPGLSTA
jgi:hypothetical protein